MFLSCDDLKLAYGVDMEIGRFYIDQKVPADNTYWKKRHLYIPPVAGYYFMPIFADLAFRAGVSKTALLSEKYITVAESILDSAGRLEQKDINWDEHIIECIHAAESNLENPAFLRDLKYYFGGQKEKASVSLGTPYSSLNRADAYLFSLCTVNFNQEVKEKLVQSWYALMTYFLILDDLADIRDDIRNKDENALLDAGLSEQGAAIISDMIDQSYARMNAINPVMANRIDHKRQNLDIAAIIKSFLQQQ
jgi:hypothetical protein